MATIGRYLAFVVLGFASLFVLSLILPFECGTVPVSGAAWPSAYAGCAFDPPTWFILLVIAWWFSVLWIPVGHLIRYCEAP